MTVSKPKLRSFGHARRRVETDRARLVRPPGAFPGSSRTRPARGPGAPGVCAGVAQRGCADAQRLAHAAALVWRGTDPLALQARCASRSSGPAPARALAGAAAPRALGLREGISSQGPRRLARAIDWTTRDGWASAILFPLSLALPSASARRFLMYGPDLACGGGHATAVGDSLSGASLGHDKLASQTRRG